MKNLYSTVTTLLIFFFTDSSLLTRMSILVRVSRNIQKSICIMVYRIDLTLQQQHPPIFDYFKQFFLRPLRLLTMQIFFYGYVAFKDFYLSCLVFCQLVALVIRFRNRKSLPQEVRWRQS